jgi:4'-phosphopantetheinyl transferase EntD
LFPLRFVVDLPFGICAAVSLPAADDFDLPSELHAEEAAYAQALPPARRRTWVGGRVALRAALAHHERGAPKGGAPGPTAPTPPILATPRGAPALPPGFVGSVSHKRELAVALVARAEGTPAETLGVDVELPARLRHDISGRVLTADERATVAELEGPARDRELLRRFAIKEAVYKALDPWVARFVSFQEVTILFHPGGGLEARLDLAGGEGPFAVELHDASDSGDGALILVAARVTPR